MPICFVYTNLKDSDVPAGFEERLAETVGKVLNKPIERVSIVMATSQRLYRIQSYDPACFLQIQSIDVFDAERNPKYTPPLINFVKCELNIPEKRVLLRYIPIEGYMIASGV